MRREWLISAALLLATAAVFIPVAGFEFTNYDDVDYILSNGQVAQGLTWAGAKWAMGAVVCSNWHPVTLLSYMLDCQLFGVNAGAIHLVNVAFHAANALLLFWFLRRVTLELWPSAIVAALFALHPMHVESVAWISERKDVLSTFFLLLTLMAYARYARNRESNRSAKGEVGGAKAGVLDTRHSTLDPAAALGSRHSTLDSPASLNPQPSTLNYLLALLFFALGLMSKAMLVTTPFVLLLLDYWPLRRFSRFTDHGSRFTLHASRFTSPASTLRALVVEKLPFFALSIAASAATFVIQRDTGAMMPEDHMPLWVKAGNAVVSYVRYIGKTIFPHDLAIYYPHPGVLPSWQVTAAAVLLAAITALAIWQHRRRPFLLFGWLWFLGTLVPVIGLVQVGNQAMADRYSYIPHIGLFVVLVWAIKDLAGRWTQGRLALGSAAVAALVACGILSARQVTYWRDSETLFRHAIAVTSANLVAQMKLGEALVEKGELDEAVMRFGEALKVQPRAPEPRAKLAQALASQGRIREAVAEYTETLRCDPKYVEVLNNLAWILSTNPDDGIRNGNEAVRFAERACELTEYRKAFLIGTLAAAYAEAGRFDQAIVTAERAVAEANLADQPAVARKNEDLLELYRARKPFRDNP